MTRPLRTGSSYYCIRGGSPDYIARGKQMPFLKTYICQGISIACKPNVSLGKYRRGYAIFCATRPSTYSDRMFKRCREIPAIAETEALFRQPRTETTGPKNRKVSCPKIFFIFFLFFPTSYTSELVMMMMMMMVMMMPMMPMMPMISDDDDDDHDEVVVVMM